MDSSLDESLPCRHPRGGPRPPASAARSSSCAVSGTRRCCTRAIVNAGFIVGNSVTVVLGAHAREVAEALRQSAASIVVNRDWSEGIASSIRLAVQTAPPGSRRRCC